MAEHAKFAPSAAHRWIACPGSIRLCENIESKPSGYAMEGTALHKVTEQCLREKIPAEQFLGMTLESPKDDPNWSKEMDEEHVDAVQFCVDHVMEVMDQNNIQGGKLEVRVTITDDCWGTVDVLLWNAESVILIDFKFGRGKSVGAEGNPQLMIYYIGALRYLKEQGLPLPPKAKLMIIQPRIPDPIREWNTTLDEVRTWYVKSVKPAFEIANESNAVCNPGEEQCQFCDAAGVCNSRANYLLGIAEDEFSQYVDPDKDSDLPMTPDVKPIAADLRSKMELSMDYMRPDIAAKILNFQPDFDNFFKSVGEWALKKALAGTTIPGYKLVYGRSNRKWSRPDGEIEKILKDKFGILEPYNKKTLSPAQAEKKVGKTRKKSLADYITKPVGKTILVDEADSREPVDIAAETEMAEFVGKTDPVGVPESPLDDITVFEDNSIDDIMAGFDEPEESTPVDAGGTQQDALAVSKEIWEGSNSSAPSKRTKKFKLMEMGMREGGISIQEAADVLFKGDCGQVTKGLRQLHERDGFTIVITNGVEFTVKEE